ncbi:MAG: 4-alpha-glucanotransferase [Actinobacteria bacterium]|nr:4-alpha-glucanotransferase [Actinomycetota bacterium]
MSEPSAILRELADAYGVATEFWDWQGRPVQVSAATIVAVLAALDVDASTDDAVRTALHARTDQAWTRMLPPCTVVRDGERTSFLVHVDHGAHVSVWIECEDGTRRSDLAQLENWTPPRTVGERLIGEATFALPDDLPLGYHTLHARSDETTAEAELIVTPTWLGLPERLGRSQRWGLTTQLYSVRSRKSWGVGDLVDLADLTSWVGQYGGDFVLINPLPAAEPVAPMEPSPYLPATRRFTNPIYIRPERIPEFAELTTNARKMVRRLRKRSRPNDRRVVDRDKAWSAKAEALRMIFDAPRSAGRELAYKTFQRRGGDGLRDFATWCAIVAQHGRDWRRWPAKLLDPRSKRVARFRDEHYEDIDFYMWLQWIVDEQLDDAQAAARRAGLRLGIMHDLAVGISSRGADAWALSDVYAQRVSVGAPPDAFNQAGQDWSQPPLRPDRLAELAYRPFREVVRSVLRHAGGVRVDHILGLFRLWWIPEGHVPTEGTYLRYDHDALVGILALEAHRAEAVVVGEDLGTVEPWVRTYLRERGILGTSILWFEFDWDAPGTPPLPPERWRELCLASITTHDLPPTAGYLAGDHVRLRHELGLLTRDLDEELAVYEQERAAWLTLLRHRGLLSDDSTDAAVAALHHVLTAAPSRLITIALTDVVGERRTQNQPGTLDEYPNWRVGLADSEGDPLWLDDILTDTRAAVRIQAARQH